MASGSTKMDPICLVENRKNQLSVNAKALKILEQISQRLVVVAVVGLYRTGKSYLMNRLAGQNHGFCLGSTVRSETKGIWMWCVPHPSKENHTLVLLDTEGLGNVEKEDSKNDLWIFALAVLLSSTFIYNSMNSINHQALQQLHYVTELTELIRTKSSPSSDEVEDSAQFVSFFPDFIWTVRDFTLELELDGNSITEDEYLENALKLSPDEGPQIQNFNLPRECIRKFFPKRKCFVFDRPASNKKQLLHLEEMPDNQLDENFQKQSKDFCSYIYTHAKTKTLKEGITVTGKSKPGPPELPAVTGRSRGRHPAGRPGPQECGQGREKRTKRQAAEMKQDLLTQELNDKKQKLEAQERSHQKNIGQLKEKFKMERENLLREQEAVLAHKLKMQKEMLTEGFKRKANELQKEILQQQKEIEDNFL